MFLSTGKNIASWYHDAKTAWGEHCEYKLNLHGHDGHIVQYYYHYLMFC